MTMVLRVRNVARALPQGVWLLEHGGDREESRAGPVLVAPVPMVTVYERPTERVLHNVVRDANPFFHLAEILWMLAGRRDAGLLRNFVADFGDRFAENGGEMHGAYGHRWRVAFGFDQLDEIVERLRRNPQDRQCVLQMWDTTPEHQVQVGVPDDSWHEYRGCDDLRGEWRDRPCNTHAYLRVRRGSGDEILQRKVIESGSVLDLTVCCRSNDIVWGAYGANAVHFSALQEYLAARIGVGVGTYYQFSNNYHAYVSELDRLRERGERISSRRDLSEALVDDRYGAELFHPEPMVDEPDSFDEEVKTVLMAYELESDELVTLRNTHLSETVWPALRAHRKFKRKFGHEAIGVARGIRAADWRAACVEWLERRWRTK